MKFCEHSKNIDCWGHVSWSLFETFRKVNFLQNLLYSGCSTPVIVAWRKRKDVAIFLNELGIFLQERWNNLLSQQFFSSCKKLGCVNIYLRGNWEKWAAQRQDFVANLTKDVMAKDSSSRICYPWVLKIWSVRYTLHSICSSSKNGFTSVGLWPKLLFLYSSTPFSWCFQGKLLIKMRIQTAHRHLSVLTFNLPPCCCGLYCTAQERC